MPQHSTNLAYRRFLGWFGGCLLAGELGLAGFNLVVDPYGINHLATLPGLNVEKTQRLYGGGRIERSLRLWLEDYETIILGSSRAQVGLDPASRVLAPIRAYNASLAGTSMAELYNVGRFVLDHERPKRIIIGLDFIMFSDDRERGNGDFESSGLAGDPMPLVFARSLVGVPALLASLRTVRDNLNGLRALTQASGFSVSTGRRSSSYEHRPVFDAVLKKLLTDSDTFGDYDYDTTRLAKLKALLVLFARAKIEVHLFVSPVHAWNAEAVDMVGLNPVLERWLRSLTEIVAEVNREATPAYFINLWDFSDYNSITSEAVPGADGADDHMAGYWDVSHYKANVGDRVVARMLGPAAGPAVIPPDFGKRLTPTTLEAVLGSRREGRSAYRQRHAADVANVAGLVATTEVARKRAQEMVGTGGT